MALEACVPHRVRCQAHRPRPGRCWKQARAVSGISVALEGCASYKWKQPQHINVLELTAFLSELRRRSRDQTQHNHRFFCIVDSLVTFYVLGKGRSSSKRLNRICRRVTALTLASGLIPVSLWTISKWNFSDGASRRFEPA